MASVTAIQQALKGVDYPASKDDLLRAAQANGADDDVLQTLSGADDRSYDGPNGVMSALKGSLGGDA